MHSEMRHAAESQRRYLVQCGKHKHGRLSHTRLGLANNVHAEHSLRNALVLDCVHREQNNSTQKQQPRGRQQPIHCLCAITTCTRRTFGRVFEPAVHNSAQTLGLQDKVTEPRAVDADVVPPIDKSPR